MLRVRSPCMSRLLRRSNIIPRFKTGIFAQLPIARLFDLRRLVPAAMPAWRTTTRAKTAATIPRGAVNAKVIGSQSYAEFSALFHCSVRLINVLRGNLLNFHARYIHRTLTALTIVGVLNVLDAMAPLACRIVLVIRRSIENVNSVLLLYY